MKIKVAAMILAFSCAGIVAQAQSPTPTPSPTKDELKKAKEKEKEKEKADKLFEKQEAKRLEKVAKQERASHLASMPEVTVVGAKSERVGQILTGVLAGYGFTLSEYQAPQNVFGMATNYAAMYTKAVTDGSTDFNMRAWVGLTYGVRVEGSVVYFMGFVIAQYGTTVTLQGRYGLAGQTVRGPALRDLSNSNESYRTFLDEVLKKTKELAESEAPKPAASPSPTP